MDSKYADKFVSAQVAAEKAVHSGDWVDYGFGAGFPELMLHSLSAADIPLLGLKRRSKGPWVL